MSETWVREVATAWLRELTIALIMHWHGEKPPGAAERRRRLRAMSDVELLAVLERGTVE